MATQTEETKTAEMINMNTQQPTQSVVKAEEDKDVDMSLFRDPNQKKREVYTQINLTRFGDINGVDQTFQGHFQIDFYWVATYEEKQQWDENGQTEDNWKPKWIPQPTIMRLSNATEVISWEIMMDTKMRDIVLLPRWGKLMWRRRYIIVAVFSESLELESYPFDIQNFSMTLQAVEHVNTWAFLPLPVPEDNAFIKLKKKFSPLSEWIYETGCVEFYATDPADSFTGKQFSLITLDIKCSRRWQTQFWNMMLPMAVLGSMGLTAFSIEIHESPEGRLGYAINIVFTVVAYQYVIRSQLPQIPYLTYMDYYVICAFSFSVILLVQPAILAALISDEDTIFEVDRICFYVLTTYWICAQIFFAIYGKRCFNKEKYKLMNSGSEINYGADTDPFEYKTLLITKKYPRKTQFGTCYFEKDYFPEDD